MFFLSLFCKPLDLSCTLGLTWPFKNASIARARTQMLSMRRTTIEVSGSRNVTGILSTGDPLQELSVRSFALQIMNISMWHMRATIHLFAQFIRLSAKIPATPSHHALQMDNYCANYTIVFCAHNSAKVSNLKVQELGQRLSFTRQLDIE